jgi:type VI secretion system protein ImpD
VSDLTGSSWHWAVGCAVVRSSRPRPAGSRRASNGLGGGVVPGPSFATDSPGLVPRAPADVAVTDRLGQDLGDLGFISLARNRETGDLVIFGVPSIQLPRKFDTAAATANARLSASLQCILRVSRFAHHLKLIGREKVGSFASPEDCETMLNGWLGKYCTRTEDTSEAERAGKPLAEGRVEVRERAGRPGCYDCVVHLKPHFQVENLVSAVRLVTEFAPIQAG